MIRTTKVSNLGHSDGQSTFAVEFVTNWNQPKFEAWLARALRVGNVLVAECGETAMHDPHYYSNGNYWCPAE